MTNFYNQSWELYKAHSESFKDDFDYYLNFTKKHKTLELFAGYGRLSNFLADNKIDIETVELEPNFAKFINIADNKNHVGDILSFKTKHAFERIIAGYNSFCLLTTDENIRKFFLNINLWLKRGGLASLSYYHPDAWVNHNGAASRFRLNQTIVDHITRIDLSRRSEKIATWSDEYIYKEIKRIFTYPTKIYETSECLIPYLSGTNLHLKEMIINYNKINISDPGWIEFVLEKK